jgi:hypothetical protein
MSGCVNASVMLLPVTVEAKNESSRARGEPMETRAIHIARPTYGSPGPIIHGIRSLRQIIILGRGRKVGHFINRGVTRFFA